MTFVGLLLLIISCSIAFYVGYDNHKGNFRLSCFAFGLLITGLVLLSLGHK